MQQYGQREVQTPTRFLGSYYSQLLWGLINRMSGRGIKDYNEGDVDGQEDFRSFLHEI